MEMKKFPKIRQFADIIRHVKSRADFQGLDADEQPIYRHEADYPTLNFTGTVKLHGTNAAVVWGENGDYHIQSRSRIITVADDNAGFAAFLAGLGTDIYALKMENCAVYGEWCGGNIQKGVAITGLPKMFVIFGAKTVGEDGAWQYLNFSREEIRGLNENNIFLISQFPVYKISIDFERPEIAQQTIIDMVEVVENECPVGRYFDSIGIGEGIVWTCDQDPTSELWFKTKGEKHSSSKVKKVAAVDIEKVNSVREFVAQTCTENRMNQGLDVLRERGIELSMKSTGDYLRWVVTDILDEEATLLGESGLCAKDVGGAISEKARPFWFKIVRGI